MATCSTTSSTAATQARALPAGDTPPHLGSRSGVRHEAGLSPAPCLEPRRRDHATVERRAGVRLPVRRPDSGANGARVVRLWQVSTGTRCRRRRHSGRTCIGLIGRALPDLPEHHRRRRARDAGDPRCAVPLKVTRWRVEEASMGQFLVNGISATLGSPRRTGPVSSTSDTRNLHVLGYSVPVNTKLPLSELREHLFTHPDNPDWIPYRTSYYNENWGFCRANGSSSSSPTGLRSGHRLHTRGWRGPRPGVRPGRAARGDSLLCLPLPPVALQRQPSRGPATARRQIAATRRLRYSYRFLFAPSTIGPLCWLWKNESGRPHRRRARPSSCPATPGADLQAKPRGDSESTRPPPTSSAPPAASSFIRPLGEGTNASSARRASIFRSGR